MVQHITLKKIFRYYKARQIFLSFSQYVESVPPTMLLNHLLLNVPLGENTDILIEIIS